MPGDTPLGWDAVVLLIVLAVGFAALAIGMSKGFDWLLGSDRTGPLKGSAYESGMPPVGDTKKRFNVRFYLVAMLFLLFDVEVVLLYPWAIVLAGTISDVRFDEPSVVAAQLPAAMNVASLEEAWGAMVFVGLLFVAILIVGFVYEWRRGIFKFD